jgi:hypothetical protein
MRKELTSKTVEWAPCFFIPNPDDPDDGDAVCINQDDDAEFNEPLIAKVADAYGVPPILIQELVSILCELRDEIHEDLVDLYERSV